MSPSGWFAGVTVLALMGGAQVASAQNKLEPTGPPGPTMKTLDEIPPTWSQVLPANDGADPCNSSRFQCVLPTATNPTGVAVLDKETGLVWQREPWGLISTTFNENWADASSGCHALVLGGRMGWRLPTVEELLSLVDRTGQAGQYLPAGHPFTQISTTDGYWTATARGGRADVVFGGITFVTGCSGCVGFREYFAYDVDQTLLRHAWCVRGGQGYDRQ
jgi:hypothetical protein